MLHVEASANGMKVISVAERSDDHHQLPQISLPGSDVH